MNDDTPQDDTNQTDHFTANPSDDVNPMSEMKSDESLSDDVSNATPFSPPDDVTQQINPTSQQHDPASDEDDQEIFDAGTDAASGATLPSEADTDNLPSENEE